MRVKALSADIASALKLTRNCFDGLRASPKRSPVRVDGNEVAAGVGDDPAAIAVAGRQSGLRSEVPGGQKGIDLGLLVEGLIVRSCG